MLAILALLLAPAALAGDMYLVRDVPAEAEGPGASEAKDRALSRAKTHALRIVFARLLPSDEAARAPLPADSATIDRFTRQFRISSERATDSSYSARVLVQFDRAQVGAYLSGLGLAPLKSEPLPTLVVAGEMAAPILADLAARLESTSAPPFRPYAMGPSEMALLKSAPALELQDLLAKTGTNGVAIMEVEGEDGNVRITLADKTGGETIAFKSDKTLLEALHRALVLFGDRLKRGAGAAGESVQAVVYFGDLADWLKKESLIRALPSVESVRLAALKYDRAQVELSCRASLPALLAALGKAGLTAESKAGYIVIR